MKKGYNFFLNLLKVKLYTLHRKKINLTFLRGGEEGAGIWALSITINFAGYHCGESNSLQLELFQYNYYY